MTAEAREQTGDSERAHASVNGILDAGGGFHQVHDDLVRNPNDDVLCDFPNA